MGVKVEDVQHDLEKVNREPDLPLCNGLLIILRSLGSSLFMNYTSGG